MVFSSPLFLFGFLPLVLGVYFLAPRRAGNLVLLFASLLFYFIGSGIYIAILLCSIAANYWLGEQIFKNQGSRREKWWLMVAISVNLLPLLVFKYAPFITAMVNPLLIAAGFHASLPTLHLFLPAGISFFTFQGLAYVIDIRRRTIAPSPSLVKFALFKSFFPLLVAGPIVRYHEIAADLEHRRHSLDQTVAGLERFGFGLAKKVLLADSLGLVADAIFNGTPSEWSTGNAWLGIVCYTLQIFFDFSGYTDMAIGLGRVFGLTLPENFCQPYRAESVTDFWRRWHMTLTRFFRDYVYIPLGGNRAGPVRTAVNLLVVFVLCGLWHGANLTFLVWGLYHGAWLIIERILKQRFGFVPRGNFGRAYTLLAVMLGWVIFRAQSLPQVGEYFRALFGQTSANPLFTVYFHLTNNVLFFLMVAIVIAGLPERPVTVVTSKNSALGWRPWFALFVTTLAVIAQSPQTFNPFIYFRF